MIKLKLFKSIIVLFLFGSSYAQDKTVVPFNDFNHIQDTAEYNKKTGDLFNIVYRKKGTIHIDDLNKLIALGEDLNSYKGLGLAYRIKGELHKEKLEYLLARKSYDKAIEYFEKVNFKSGIARTYNDMFIVEYTKGDFEKSVSYLLESKKYFEHLKDSTTLISINNNLGAVYKYLKKYESAEEAFSKCLELQTKLGNIQIKGTIMSNLGSVYIAQKKYKKAKEIIEKAIFFDKNNDEMESLKFSYGMLSEVYIVSKEYKKAKIYNDSALYAFKKGTNNLSNTYTKQRSGVIELGLGNYKKADELFTMTREAFEKADSKKGLLENYKLSSTLDSTRGNLSGALVWQKKYQKLSDQRMSEISTKKIENAETRYQEELDQLRVIDAQEKREQRNKAELFRYRIFTFIIIGILLVSLVLLFWVIRTRKERKQLITSLNDSNDTKNKLFSIISHDLKNEIHGLESSLNLMKDNEISSDEFEEIVPILADRTNQTSILLNNLLNWSKSQMKQLRANPISFDVTEVVSTKFKFFQAKAVQKDIQLINKLSTTRVYADKDMVSIVTQNLIANAIKFCTSGDSITLISKEEDNYYQIGFSDTGVGIEPDNLNKLFAEDTFTTLGTQNESGTGLGLRICKELIELNKGSIKVESTVGVGSTFFISLPKVTT